MTSTYLIGPRSKNAGLRSDIHIKRVRAEEVEVIKINDEFSFPVKEGSLLLPGEQPRVLVPKSPSKKKKPEENDQTSEGNLDGMEAEK